MTRSMASSRSAISTASLPFRAASSAASLMMFARSAPAMPGVRAAITCRSTCGASVTLRAWTARMASRPLTSGLSTTTWRSKRPARSSAASSTSGRLVAAMMMTPLEESKPSISARSWFRVCSRSSCPPTNPPAPPRVLPMASSSSMKTMQGAFSLACSNRSRTRAAPTPTNISTNSEPDRKKKGTSASPATARARSVLPVPGDPTRRTPFGIRPPRRWYFFGCLRKSTTSTSSALASSTPATSAKEVLSSLRSKIFALDRPKESACVGPPPMRRMRNIQMPAMIASGTIQPKSRSRQNVFSIRPENSTLCASSSLSRVESSTPGMRVVVKMATVGSAPRKVRTRSPGRGAAAGRAPGLRVPRISLSVSETRSTFSSRTRARKRLMGTSTVCGASSQLWSTDRTRAAMRT